MTDSRGTLQIGGAKADGLRATVRVHSTLPADHSAYALIGRVAAEWARLEHILDAIIWDIVGIRFETGSCITGQMIGHRPRFNAISALGTLRGLNAKILSDIETHQGKTSELAKKRNRIVHDAWFIESGTGQIGQFRSVLPKADTFGIEDIDPEKVGDIIKKIADRCNSILQLRDQILAELRSSR
jgi:hypothetical protein